MSEPTSASYGSVPPGFVCGRCGKPLSTKWVDACKNCGTRFIEVAPKATDKTPDPMGDSAGIRRFRVVMYAVVVIAVIGGLAYVAGISPAVTIPLILVSLAIGWSLFRRMP